MRKIIINAFTAFSVTMLITTAAFSQSLDGAWKLTGNNNIETTSIIADNYFMQSRYDKANKLFLGTMGGVFKTNDNGQIEVSIEFNTTDSTWVGQTFSFPYQLKDDQLIISIQGNNDVWQRIDKGNQALSGNWRITEREQNGQMIPMRAGPRKTLKILSGTRFQWAAINTETKEFFGSGGGTYSFNDGKYTENIEFFSRDNSRAGASLSFEGKVDGKRWHHSGKSSKGDPISEIWTRQQ